MIFVPLMAFLGACSTVPKPAAMQVSRQMDSLAAASAGDYIHLRIGDCAGQCNAMVSIYRTTPAHRYTYEAEGWRYDDVDRAFVLYRLRRPMLITEANNLLGEADRAELFAIAGQGRERQAVTPAGDAPVWIRARIGARTISLDDVYLPGGDAPEVGPPAPGLSLLRTILLTPLYQPTK